MKHFLLLLFLFLPKTGGAIEAPDQKVWIFFTDKGDVFAGKASELQEEAEARLSARAVARRKKMSPDGGLTDAHDIAIHQNYLRALEQAGIAPLVQSRWLNAVSAYVSPLQNQIISEFPFVKNIQPVRLLRTPNPVQADPTRPLVTKPASKTRFDYGASRTQIEQINVHLLHNAGIFGAGVVVGMLDTGFDFRDHEAFQEMEILGEFDFIQQDSVTANEDSDHQSQHNHGTQTLSVIGAFAPGQLIGPAYGAQFYLSKTEDLVNETPLEEDNWMAAIEWMERRGIDVASSSLGYSVFDDQADNYSLADLDGMTAVVSRAAQIATEKGVVVVNSAGNTGNSSTWSKIIAPADAKDVIAAGGVVQTGERVSFSAFGPTADGRIKPDVMAMASGVQTVQPGSVNGYRSSSGTSFSCPLIAGVAAQILSSHPDLTPRQVNEALRMTASQSGHPDTLNGYGIVDARAAITYWGPAFSNQFSLTKPGPNDAKIAINCLTGANAVTMTLFWRREGETGFAETPMTQADSILFESQLISFAGGEKIELYFSVRLDNNDGAFTHPRTAPLEVFAVSREGVISRTANIETMPDEFALPQNYPNPFVLSKNAITRVALQSKKTAIVSLSVFNVLGQEVARILDRVKLPAGARLRSWDGRSTSGQKLSAGLYFLRAVFETTDGERVVKLRKMMIIE